MYKVNPGTNYKDTRCEKISLEMAQMVVSKQAEGDSLPDWFVVEIVRDLPRLVEKKDGA